MLLFITASFSLEWGGIVNDSTTGSLQNYSIGAFEQSNSVFFWLKTPVKKNLNFSAEAFYKYVLSVSGGVSSFTNIVDSDLLKLAGKFDKGTSSLSFGAGRFSVSDISSVVYAQLIDGFSIQYDLPVFKVSGFAGYTGLLNSLSVSMVDVPSKPSANTQGYVLSHGFIPLSATFEIPVIFNNQSLKVSLNSYIDTESTKINKYYGILDFSGPITNTCFYDFATVVGSVNFNNLMNYTKILLYIFPIQTMMISTGVEYASGNNGFLSPFQGITYITAYKSADSPLLSGVIMPQASLSAVFGNISAGLMTKYIIGAADSISNKGFEIGLNCNYNIFTDLRVGGDVSAFFDMSNSDNSLLRASVNFALAF